MQRIPVITKDGSYTFSIPEMDVTYHSLHGAITESLHIFIREGLLFKTNQGISQLRIFEMGFGTGLNALLSILHAGQTNIHYTSVEAFPLEAIEYKAVDYCSSNNPACKDLFTAIHQATWDAIRPISDNFFLEKRKIKLQDYVADNLFDVIYYDAFAPAAQPELWTKEIFDKLFSMLSPGGILLTYCSKGEVRRAMMAAGFAVEKIPGPPGKREIVRATKI